MIANTFLIAAPWSNSGKTTVTLGLARYFKNSGYKVQTFKCGPDYIDSIHHSRATQRPSVNLDMMMMSDRHIKDVFTKHTMTSDINIIEGVMGLFDGAQKDKASSAALAKLLDIPVILVVNAKAMAYTIAPILHGLKNFDSSVNIAGVVFNFVKTASHYQFLQQACQQVGIPSLGYIPPNDGLKIPSRHLGLHIENYPIEFLDNTATHISKHIDIDKLLDITTVTKVSRPYQIDLFSPSHTVVLESKSRSNKIIAIAKDEAFTFTYTENLNYLSQFAQIVFFSPIHDSHLSDVVDLIYLAGGYPELYLDALSANVEMRRSILALAQKGVKILAECGGMMYLGKQIIDQQSNPYPMVGIFNFTTSMEVKKLHLGYRKFSLDQNQEVWGHEFHYSTIFDDQEYMSFFQLYTARDKSIGTRVYRFKNVIASYVHWYWSEGNWDWFIK